MKRRNGHTPVEGVPLPQQGERWDITPLPPTPPGPEQPPAAGSSGSAEKPTMAPASTVSTRTLVAVAALGLAVLGVAWKGAERLAAKAERVEVQSVEAKAAAKADRAEVQSVDRRVRVLELRVEQTIGYINTDLAVIREQLKVPLSDEERRRRAAAPIAGAEASP